MRKRACALLAVLLWGVGALGALDSHVGTVLSSVGEAAIDAFGKGVYIPVEAGDALYRDTVLRTGPSGSMALRLDEVRLEVPPGSTVRVEELLAAGRRRRGLGWFQVVLAVIGNIAGSGEEAGEEVVLGSRAFEVPDSELGFEWAEEEDEDELAWKAARADLDQLSFAAALRTLLGIRDPDGLDEALPGEVDYLIGTCYFQLGNYGDAALRLERAYGSIARSGLGCAVLPYCKNLLFQLGAADYLLGREASSAERLETLLKAGPPPEVRPYLYLFLIRALRGSGRTREARARLEEAQREFRGTPFEPEIKQLSTP